MLQTSTFGRLYIGLSCITHLFRFLTNPNRTHNQLKFQYCVKMFLWVVYLKQLYNVANLV